MFYFLFLKIIVRRPWPNFVCKGRHTSSVVLVLTAITEQWPEFKTSYFRDELICKAYFCFHFEADPPFKLGTTEYIRLCFGHKCLMSSSESLTVNQQKQKYRQCNLVTACNIWSRNETEPILHRHWKPAWNKLIVSRLNGIQTSKSQ